MAVSRHTGEEEHNTKLAQLESKQQTNSNVGQDNIAGVDVVCDDDTCGWRCYLRAAACFEQGREVEQDKQEAQRLYRLCHHARAQREQQQRADTAEEQFHLGECYEHGRGVDKDEKEAARLYRLSSEQGNADGQWRLGACYYRGRGVEKDLNEAVRLFRLSVGQGNSTGQCSLGLCYEFGKGVAEKDFNEAVRLYRLSSDQGNSIGQRSWHVLRVWHRSRERHP